MAVAGCSALAAALCFMPWYTISFAGEMGAAVQAFGEAGVNMGKNAFDFSEGVMAFLLALVAAGTIPAEKAQILRLHPRASRSVPLVACAGAILCMLFFLGGSGARNIDMMPFSAGKTAWFYVSLVLMVVAGYHAFKRCQPRNEVEGVEQAG